MIEQIKALESRARKLELSHDERETYSEKAFRYVQQFIDDLPAKKAFVTSGDKGKGVLDTPFTEDGESLDELLSLLEKEVDTPGLNPASAGHLGFIPGSGIFPSALGDLLAAISNRYAGVFFSSPGAVRIENMCIRWMCDLVGYPEDSAGNLTSGGSIANLVAFVTARDHAGLKAGNFDKAVIYTTRQAHHSAEKSFKFAGMGEAVIRYIPMDDRYRMKPDALDARIQQDKQEGLIPFIIFASAGTTDVGAVDPLRELGDIADNHNIWFHVDAAYGGFFLLTDHGKEKMAGIERANSVIIDPHKGLFLPFGTGAVLVRNGQTLYESQHMTASYLQDTLNAIDEMSPADLSPELSKHFRGLRMWLPLQLFGVRPFRAGLEEKLMLTRYFYEEVQKIEGIEVGPKPELSVMYFRYVPEDTDPNRFNAELVKRIHEDGRVFLTSTKLDGNFYIRLAVLNFRTHLNTIDLTLEILREKIAELNEEYAAT